jgi:hypothetical protein
MLVVPLKQEPADDTTPLNTAATASELIGGDARTQAGTPALAHGASMLGKLKLRYKSSAGSAASSPGSNNTSDPQNTSDEQSATISSTSPRIKREQSPSPAPIKQEEGDDEQQVTPQSTSSDEQPLIQDDREYTSFTYAGIEHLLSSAELGAPRPYRGEPYYAAKLEHGRSAFIRASDVQWLTKDEYEAAKFFQDTMKDHERSLPGAVDDNPMKVEDREMGAQEST